MKEKSIVPPTALAWPRPHFLGRATESRAMENCAASPLRVHDDAQLVRRLAAGESDAIALIYDRYAPSLYRVLSAILGSPADAEDALQETFVALATHHKARIRDLKSYLIVAARHQAFSILRRRKREHGWEDVSQLEIAAPQNPETPHDFAALLAKLPLQQREIIALKVWEELTFAEIAAIVRISSNTAQSRYRYGIERLRAWCEAERCKEENLD